MISLKEIAPLFQDSINQPRREDLRFTTRRYLVNICSKQLMRKGDRGGDPSRSTFNRSETDVSIKAGRDGLDHCGNITEPRRPPRAVLEQMHGQQSQLIFVC